MEGVVDIKRAAPLATAKKAAPAPPASKTPPQDRAFTETGRGTVHPVELAPAEAPPAAQSSSTAVGDAQTARGMTTKKVRTIHF
jgi:hypothetical protein